MKDYKHWLDEFIEFDNPKAELLLEICFGLLWMENREEARRVLSKYLTHAQKGSGIEKAREILKAAGKREYKNPIPISRALERLERAADNCQLWEDNEMDGSMSAITYRAAAMHLENWVKGFERVDQAHGIKGDTQ